MQQTEKYQFNLIEGSDPFLPEALNDNARKLEAALEDHRAETARLLAGQEETLTGKARIITGTYLGTGTTGVDHPMTLEADGELERPPGVIIVSDLRQEKWAVLIRGMPRAQVVNAGGTSFYIQLTWTDRGVRWHTTDGTSINMNNAGETYYYAIFI